MSGCRAAKPPHYRRNDKSPDYNYLLQRSQLAELAGASAETAIILSAGHYLQLALRAALLYAEAREAERWPFPLSGPRQQHAKFLATKAAYIALYFASGRYYDAWPRALLSPLFGRILHCRDERIATLFMSSYSLPFSFSCRPSFDAYATRDFPGYATP